MQLKPKLNRVGKKLAHPTLADPKKHGYKTNLDYFNAQSYLPCLWIRI